MNDAEYARQKARVEALHERWVKPLGLAWWRIEYIWNREEKIADSEHGAEWVRRTYFEVAASWKYLEAKIACWLGCIEDLSDEALEHFFVHELGHIFVNELRDVDGVTTDYMEHEERVATTLGKAFVWLRQMVEDEAQQPDPLAWNG